MYKWYAEGSEVLRVVVLTLRRILSSLSLKVCFHGKYIDVRQVVFRV